MGHGLFLYLRAQSPSGVCLCPDNVKALPEGSVCEQVSLGLGQSLGYPEGK